MFILPVQRMYGNPCYFFRLMSQPAVNNGALAIPKALDGQQQRFISLTATVSGGVRHFFPRPSEVKRIKKHGWKQRLSTPAARQILMRRILKGRHVLTH